MAAAATGLRHLRYFAAVAVTLSFTPGRGRLRGRGRRHVDLAELSGEELVWFSRGTALRAAVEAARARAGITASPRCRKAWIGRTAQTNHLDVFDRCPPGDQP
jgi:DNA-binding transcriptional LysR family regulator